jgi:hypothetical protein
MQTRSRTNQEAQAQTQTKTNQTVRFLNTNNSSTHNNEIPINVLTQMEGIRTRAQLRAAAHNAKTNGLRQSPRLNGNLPDYSSFF